MRRRGSVASVTKPSLCASRTVAIAFASLRGPEQQSAVRRAAPACTLHHADFGKLLGAGLGVAEGKPNAESARAVFEQMQPDRLRARLPRHRKWGRATRRQQIGGTRVYCVCGDGREQGQHGVHRVLRSDDADFRRRRGVAGKCHVKSWAFARLGGLQRISAGSASRPMRPPPSITTETSVRAARAASAMACRSAAAIAWKLIRAVGVVGR